MLAKHPLIRTIYLYLFALLGLVLLIIGGVGFVRMGLEAYVFTKANDEQRLYSKQPPMPYSVEQVQKIADGTTAVKLTADEQTSVHQWIKDYQTWQEQQKDFDVVVAQRQRNAANYLAMILIGLPLYLYHWGVIKKETKEKENA